MAPSSRQCKLQMGWIVVSNLILLTYLSFFFKISNNIVFGNDNTASIDLTLGSISVNNQLDLQAQREIHMTVVPARGPSSNVSIPTSGRPRNPCDAAWAQSSMTTSWHDVERQGKGRVKASEDNGGTYDPYLTSHEGKSKEMAYPIGHSDQLTPNGMIGLNTSMQCSMGLRRWLPCIWMPVWITSLNC